MEPLVRKEAATLEEGACKPHDLGTTDDLRGRRLVTEVRTNEPYVSNLTPCLWQTSAMPWSGRRSMRENCVGARDQGRGSKRRPGMQITDLDLIGEDNAVTERRADFFHAQRVKVYEADAPYPGTVRRG